jgi:hypothetical protein
MQITLSTFTVEEMEVFCSALFLFLHSPLPPKEDIAGPPGRHFCGGCSPFSCKSTFVSHIALLFSV